MARPKRAAKVKNFIWFKLKIIMKLNKKYVDLKMENKMLWLKIKQYLKMNMLENK